MALYQLEQWIPQLAPGAWVADNAQLIGNVHLGENTSIWFGVVVRGDTEVIRLGRNTNIQDLSMLHADVGVPLTIGDDVSVGHQVTLHGCTVGSNTLIGIGAVVLNHARIGNNCIVGAHSLVTEGKVFPDNSLIMGSPAKVVRQLDDAAIAKIAANARHYVANAQRYRAAFKRID